MTVKAQGPKRRDVAGYEAAHRRVFKDRGPAERRTCWRCGSAQAAEWAYDHADPDELEGFVRDRGPFAYSLKPHHYLPMCKPCHWAFDQQEHKCPIPLPSQRAHESTASSRPQPDRATGSSLKTEPSTDSETPAISAVSWYRQTLSSNDHDHPEHGWMYDPNGWELV